MQSYTLPIGIDGQQPDISNQGFDGASELQFDSPADMEALFADPDYLVNVRPDAGAISIYYATRTLLPAKTRVFVDFVVEAFERQRLAERFAGNMG